MAVANNLQQYNDELLKRNQDKAVKFQAGDETVTLTPNIIRQYLVSGDSNNVTNQEIALFLNLCRYQHLNPFLREAYLVKYGTAPATIVTGKDAFMKRAQRNKSYRGIEAGVIVLKKDGVLENRSGALVLNGEDLVGGWAKVHIDGYEVPVEVSVSYEEYVGRKKSGEINSMWSTKPATMIRKVAVAQALREAFPDDLSGMYSQEEMNIDSSMLDEMPISIEDISEASGIPETTPNNYMDDDPLA